MRVVSIGDLVTDFYYMNRKLVGVNGGMTSHNIIANISKLKLDTAVYGVCGNDDAGKASLKSLKDVKVNIDNIEIRNNLNTRCFHVSYTQLDGQTIFESKRRCPDCNEKKWYYDSQIEPKNILNSILENDVLVFDNLNSKNQIIINNCYNGKMLDLGQYFELDNYSNLEIIETIKYKFDIINLNERVEKYLKNRFSLSNLKDIYNILEPKMIIVTRGREGSDFIVDNQEITKILDNPSKEVDPTGAGDAFFSVFITEYIKNDFIINEKFIDNTFEEATKLTKKVVIKIGARGHINNLYKIKKIKNKCLCSNFDINIRKQVKRCNININNLESRVINAIESNAYTKLKKVNFKNDKFELFIGTGGSLAAAKFSSKIINNMYGISTQALLPRDVYYRNNCQVDKAFLFSYSGTTNDLLVATNSISNEKKIIITKGETQKIIEKTKNFKNNIISYRNGNNKTRERGFLSFEGVVAPASLFLKLYFEENNIKDINKFIIDCMNYWKIFFKENNNILKSLLVPNSQFNIFTGDYTESAGIDFESKIVESGIFTCLVHEKKNFSHGRFISYEHLGTMKNIYFRQNSISEYEKKLLEYLNKGTTLIIQSKFDGILCEYDLLVASQYLIHYISNFLNIDISKPTYSDRTMEIYHYKGEL